MRRPFQILDADGAVCGAEPTRKRAEKAAARLTRQLGRKFTVSPPPDQGTKTNA